MASLEEPLGKNRAHKHEKHRHNHGHKKHHKKSSEKSRKTHRRRAEVEDLLKTKERHHVNKKQLTDVENLPVTMVAESGVLAKLSAAFGLPVHNLASTSSIPTSKKNRHNSKVSNSRAHRHSGRHNHTHGHRKKHVNTLEKPPPSAICTKQEELKNNVPIVEETHSAPDSSKIDLDETLECKHEEIAIMESKESTAGVSAVKASPAGNMETNNNVSSDDTDSDHAEESDWSTEHSVADTDEEIEEWTRTRSLMKSFNSEDVLGAAQNFDYLDMNTREEIEKYELTECVDKSDMEENCDADNDSDKAMPSSILSSKASMNTYDAAIDEKEEKNGVIPEAVPHKSRKLAYCADSLDLYSYEEKFSSVSRAAEHVEPDTSRKISFAEEKETEQEQEEQPNQNSHFEHKSTSTMTENLDFQVMENADVSAKIEKKEIAVDESNKCDGGEREKMVEPESDDSLLDAEAEALGRLKKDVKDFKHAIVKVVKFFIPPVLLLPLSVVFIAVFGTMKLAYKLTVIGIRGIVIVIPKIYRGIVRFHKRQFRGLLRIIIYWYKSLSKVVRSLARGCTSSVVWLVKAMNRGQRTIISWTVRLTMYILRTLYNRITTFWSFIADCGTRPIIALVRLGKRVITFPFWGGRYLVKATKRVIKNARDNKEEFLDLAVALFGLIIIMLISTGTLFPFIYDILSGASVVHVDYYVVDFPKLELYFPSFGQKRSFLGALFGTSKPSLLSTLTLGLL